jgi:DNA-binding NarL/FixJ family response regulator
MKTIRVLLADDHAVMREGLALLVNSQRDMRVVAQATDGQEAFERAQALRPDVAVLDLAMPRVNGLKAAEEMRRACPQVKVIALSMHGYEIYLRELLKAQAMGYVLKESAGEELLKAIREVMAGRTHFDAGLAAMILRGDLLAGPHPRAATPGHLTGKEETVLRLIAWGYTNKEIAARLSLSPKTVESYKARFGRKLGLHGRTELVRYALRRGWLVDLEDSLVGGLRA